MTVNFEQNLKDWLAQDNLIGIDQALFEQKIKSNLSILYNYNPAFLNVSECLPSRNKERANLNYFPQVLIVEENPENFLAALIAVLLCSGSIFLGNPHWQNQEWQQVFNLIQPDLILGKIPENIAFSSQTSQIQTTIEIPKKYRKSTRGLSPLLEESEHLKQAVRYDINQPKITQSYFYIPTGGSSGKIKFATHSWQTLSASVQGMQNYFEIDHIHSFCILPLYHVSGLMQFIRAVLTQGKLQIYDYSQLKNKPPSQNYTDYFISLVPTQLQFLLNHFPQWLAPFKTVLLGGAPAWPSLLEQAKLNQINLAPTYGMSETASQIATLKPADFAKNYAGVGQVLPQAKVIITNEKGEILQANQIGLVSIQSKSLFLGYYPELKMFESFCPGDLGYFDQQDYLHIVGRQDQQINTGGEKVFPGEVEAVILASNLVRDVIVFGLDNSQWGEVVVAVYVPKFPIFEIKFLQNYLKQNLAAYKVPKYWQSCLSLGRSPSGKVNYAQLKANFKADP